MFVCDRVDGPYKRGVNDPACFFQAASAKQWSRIFETDGIFRLWRILLIEVLSNRGRPIIALIAALQDV